jgi:hypothetical protein
MPEDSSKKKPSDRRRSQRVFLSVGILVEGDTPQGKFFAEETSTLAVSAHGALILLANEVAIGQKIHMIHRSTGERQQSRVAYRGSVHSGKTEVGVEFINAAPRFWQIDFPPTDWTPAGE